MLGKRMGFASFIATMFKLVGRHRFMPLHILPARLDYLPRIPPRDRRLFLSIAGSYAPIFP